MRRYWQLLYSALVLSCLVCSGSSAWAQISPCFSEAVHINPGQNYSVGNFAIACPLAALSCFCVVQFCHVPGDGSRVPLPTCVEIVPGAGVKQGGAILPLVPKSQ